VFRSFFPVPKVFFSSAVIWLGVAMLIWFSIGGSIRSAISIDRFIVPAICAPVADPAASAPGSAAPTTPATNPAPSTADPAASTAKPAAGSPAGQANPSAPATTESAAPEAAVSAANCIPDDGRFLSGAKIWEYQFVVMTALLFCIFWYFYKRNEWYWWSVVTSSIILLAIYFNVQIDAWLNNWYGEFYNLIQAAMTTPNSVSLDRYFGEIATVTVILVPNIIALVLLAFITSHYIFRWRKAMTAYYMSYWPSIRTTEGAAQRVQEDTMRFASIMEGLGTDLFGSLITLAVFLPLLWGLSSNITELPLLGHVPGSLVWVALVSAALGTVLLAVVGVKLPGLNFENQRVEAAYRKELVYGEDYADRAQPMTSRQLFANVQKNYFRLYFHYLYFNVARYAYLQGAVFIPYVALGPSIISGAITLGLFQQVLSAFGQVSNSFRFLASSWTTIIELMSVRKRLLHFERSIPRDAQPLKPSLSSYVTE
jgi:peptide/bleomycin uptake transporter